VAIKIKIPRRRPVRPARGGARPAKRDTVIRAAVAAFIIASTICLAVFAYFYTRYERIIDRRMSGQIFTNTAKLYALPKEVRRGDKLSAAEIASELRRAGYSEFGKGSKIGEYRMHERGIEVRPGPASYHSEDGAMVTFAAGKVSRIVGRGGSVEGRELGAYELEPQLVTALFDQERSKRQIIQYKDIPKILVDAVIAIEDRRFFQHSGVNYFRLAQAAMIDLRERSHGQGGSTITMQISRGFFLTPQKTIKRKLTEILIAIELEQKFTKQQIFELYANQVYMGQRGSFTINGFAEAARAYFNKDLPSLTLPEAALLAAIIQRPNYLSPYKNPERALSRRNLVLESMVETGAVKREECERAKAAPLKLAPPNVEASDAPYFVDLVKDQLSSRYNERDLNEQAFRIYTTLDPDLQRVAAEAVQVGMKEVDAQVQKLRTRKRKVGKGKSATVQTTVLPGPQAQVALLAMDPHSGEVLALVGGRNYGMSQLNHAVARRPTGSIFKPFVYAAAMNTAISDAEHAVTPASLIEDNPSTFTYGDQIYEPRNYKEEYHGLVTARYALAMSLNNATVKLAEQVGYDRVAELARAAGIQSVKATPAMALGAYDATPLEMAGAYTVFANGGTRASPLMIRSVRNAQGDVMDEFQAKRAAVLDPRIAYIMSTMMESVVNSGTAAGVRARGFTAPAAGKTGTSHDAWFAGYTSNLLCIVWVGYDDYSDLRLSGSSTAAPIWAEFMKRAVALPHYRDVSPFVQPTGVVDVRLDKITNRLATPNCPQTYQAAFIAGTEPKENCEHGGPGILSRMLGIGSSTPLPPPTTNGPLRAVPPTGVTQQQPVFAEEPRKKKGFFGKIVGIFKDDKPASPPPQAGAGESGPR
jgi:penicillin-binding protein 1B